MVERPQEHAEFSDEFIRRLAELLLSMTEAEPAETPDADAAV